MWLFAGPLMAQQPAPVFHVIEQTVVPLKDGGNVTFKLVEPPVRPAVVPLPAPVPTPAELARQQELEGKSARFLAISASVHPQGLTVLRWRCDNGAEFQAVSNVNFHHLEGLGQLETAQCWYSLFMSIGSETDALSPEAAQAAQHLPTQGTPSFVLLQDQQTAGVQDEPALQAMQDLMIYYAAHQAALVAQHAQRQTEAFARERAARNAPPPAPRNSVIHFWPLQPAQRAAIDASTQARQEGAGSNP